MGNSQNYAIVDGKGHPDEMDAYVRMKLWYCHLKDAEIMKGDDGLYYIVQNKELKE